MQVPAGIGVEQSVLGMKKHMDFVVAITSSVAFRLDLKIVLV